MRIWERVEGPSHRFVAYALIGLAYGQEHLGRYRAAVANLAFAAAGREPGVLMVVLFSIAGAVGSMYLQRYFIIVGTGFGGAWTIVVGALALAGDRVARAAASVGTVWVVYPLDPAPGRGWVPIAWIVLGLAGVAVQLGWTAGEKGRVARGKKK